MALQVARDDAIPRWYGARCWGAASPVPITSISPGAGLTAGTAGLVEEGFVDAAFGPSSPRNRSAAVFASTCNPIRTPMVVAPNHPLAGLEAVLQQDLTDHTQVTLSLCGRVFGQEPAAHRGSISGCRVSN